jgi:hypothetical protein
LTTSQPDELGPTAPIELPGHQPPPSPPVAPPPAEAVPGPELSPQLIQPDGAAVTTEVAPHVVARAATPAEREVMFVPLAVSIGDGFKFGCGFFIAMVIAGLVGFVLLALLFVITGLLGLNLPVSR